MEVFLTILLQAHKIKKISPNKTALNDLTKKTLKTAGKQLNEVGARLSLPSIISPVMTAYESETGFSMPERLIFGTLLENEMSRREWKIAGYELFNYKPLKDLLTAFLSDASK